ncbi:MAG: PIN domain-containing protein [Alphaproteobacteria bacterium]|nr:MAG: PIN domain-containing protein [Alphaproteobacteria bacterium]
MIAVLDACVLVPLVTRRLLLAAARLGHLQPVWSARILGEWERAAGRHGAADAALARLEAEALARDFPRAMIAPQALPGLMLPDPADGHVVETCVAAGAAFLVTRNRRDFPRATLARYGISRLDPDQLLARLAAADARLALEARALALGLSPGTAPAGFLKRAGLPHLARRIG